MTDESGNAQQQQAVADVEFRQLCSDLTLQTKKDGFFKDYLATVTEKVSPEEFEAFSRQATDRDRVAYCWTLPAFHETMPAVRTNFYAKSTEESIKRRQMGNEYFQDKDYRKALILYNQSVIHAPYNSVLDHTTLALALANRSAALVHLKEYETAVRDIQLALQSGYPDNQKHKLYDRLGYCYQQLGDGTRARTAYTVALDCLDRTIKNSEQNEDSSSTTASLENFKRSLQSSLSKLDTIKAKSLQQPAASVEKPLPSLLNGPHPQFPSASSCLNMTVDDVAGRYFKAGEDIKAGQTLVCETPYASCLLPEKFGSHCHHCFVRLIAGLGCTKCRGVAYCSVECRDQAGSTYHRFECGINNILTASGASILSWLAIRMLTQTKLSTFLDLRKELDKEGTSKTFQHYPPQDYRSIYQLATLSHLRPAKDFFHRTLMALFLFQCLRASGYLGDRELDEDPQSITEEELFIASLLLRHLELLQFNAHEIHEFIQLTDRSMRSTKSVYIGVGIYPTVAFFNHGCRPDVARYFIGTKLVVCSSRSIQKGEPVHENYGPIFTHKSKADRQCSLKGRYWFTCQCLACQEDWPQYEGMADIETALVCCPLCRGRVVNAGPAVDNNYVLCLNCKKPSTLEAVRRPVEEMTALYQTAMSVMDQAQVDKAVQLLSLFIDMMEALLDNPTKSKTNKGSSKVIGQVRELYLAQEALRLCLGTLGTKYTADTHLTLSVARRNQ